MKANAVPASRFDTADLSIVDYADGLAGTFHDINAAWIAADFTLEPGDIDMLGHPHERIVAPGGCILFVAAAGLGIVGTCALRRQEEGVFELTKMGVLASARGRKAGEFLLEAILERAVAMPIETLYLLTNARARAAIHLYEKLGFVHDAAIMARFGAAYARCDVAMSWPIAAVRAAR